MVIHAVLAIVNVPFVTAYFTKSVPRQIVDRGRSGMRVRISAGRQATPKEPLRAVCTEADGEDIRRGDLSAILSQNGYKNQVETPVCRPNRYLS